jgi:hypothetical protein
MEITEIDWGNDSAEKDAHLLEYFIDSTAFQRVAEGRKSIVVGRKGSGKSALLKKLTEHFSAQPDTYLTVLTPKYNNIRTVLNDSALREDFGEEIFFQHTWLRQICLDFLCCVGHHAKGGFCAGSLEFARRIAASQDCTSKDFVENITEVLGRIKVKAGNLGDFGLAVESELRKVAELESLLHHVGELTKAGATFVVLIDDLDLGWDNSRTANNLLLGLLSAAGHLAGMNHSIKTILFLREDVYTILLEQTQHADKYRDVERVRWSQEQLVSILEARINFNRERGGEKPVETAFFSVFPETIGTANTDNWLIERTLSRPRELIQFARYYTESLDEDVPSDKKLKEAEPEYSNWKLNDLCAEYSNQYPGLSAIFAHWKTAFFRRKYHLDRKELEDMVLDLLSSVVLDAGWFNRLVDDTDIDGFLKIMYEIGFLGDFVLGGSGGSRTYYSHQEYHEPVFDEAQVHPCFRRAVNTVQRIRER